MMPPGYPFGPGMMPEHVATEMDAGKGKRGSKSSPSAPPAEEEQRANTAMGVQLGLPSMSSFSVDASKMSNSFKASGMAHVHGEKRVTSFRFRAQFIVSCNGDGFSFFGLAACSPEYLDLVIYIVAKLRPDIRISGLGMVTNFDIRKSIRRAYELHLPKNRTLTAE